MLVEINKIPVLPLVLRDGTLLGLQVSYFEILKYKGTTTYTDQLEYGDGHEHCHVSK